MFLNLKRIPLYEAPMVKKAREFRKAKSVKVRKEFDREIKDFTRYICSVDPKISDAVLQRKDIVFVSSEYRDCPVALMMFRGEFFTKLSDLEKMCHKKFAEIDAVADKPTSTRYKPLKFISASVNLEEVGGKLMNTITAIGEFQTDVELKNFCKIL